MKRQEDRNIEITDNDMVINYQALQQNLIDVIKEEQIKIGYMKEVIRLYYPMESVDHLLGIKVNRDLTISKEHGIGNNDPVEKEHNDLLDRTDRALSGFEAYSKKLLGGVTFTRAGERYCFLIPEQGVTYVHDQVKDNPFLTEFIGLMGSCHVDMDQVRSLFNKYSDQVVCEPVTHGEFDQLFYFKDGNPDEYKYCLKQEGEHMIYHRFTIQDYEDLDL